MTNPIITICIANYNKGPYIKECLDSIIKFENIENIEIIIVDDCSNDNSKEIIKNWIDNNKEIKIIFNENKENKGPGYTYNQTIKKSNGEFITFMDSDDFFILSTLDEKRKKLLKNPDFKIIYGNGTFYENNILSGLSIHKNIFNTFKFFDNDTSKILENIYCKVPLLSISSSLIRKDFLQETGGFDEEIFSNDWVLNIKIFQKLRDKNYFSIDENIAFGYRIYENNISKNYDKILSMLSEVIEKYCPEKLKNIGYSNIYFTNSLSNLSIGNYKKAFSSIKKSLKYKFKINKIIVFIIAFLIPKKLLNMIPKKSLNKIKSFILKKFQ
ncbi:glycosyltransferase family 2 protein [Candidatus Gracilibacteria bacterium]|nr:glycosyltransferase family 2 protein [Candidatus Gracilibacteria bacterium]NUJ99017.1 glycosyltransferase family 2 protein [Candidatus Gracilibacteria bacterium]